MFDLRSQIFRHLQRMHVAFFDKNPVGRLVTRVTTDVDALNEMFTAGVVSIFEDVFVLFFILAIMLNMNWKLALITFAVLPVIVYATKIFRDRVANRRGGSGPRSLESTRTCKKRSRACWSCNSSIEKSRLPTVFEDQRQPHGSVQRRDHGVFGLLPSG